MLFGERSPAASSIKQQSTQLVYCVNSDMHIKITYTFLLCHLYAKHVTLSLELNHSDDIVA